MGHLSVTERVDLGRAARKETSRSSHAEFEAASDRVDPVSLLEEQNATRVPWLVPLRHARMRVSPFTFYRGTARIMAADLASTPVSGLQVQLGGDAHLSNFGAYASPERKLVFDANDFDETLRGPWEWDLKRLATSVLIAGRHVGFRTADCEMATAGVVESYRDAMKSFAEMGFLQVWYEHAEMDDIARAGGMDRAELEKRVAKFEKRAKRKDNLQALDRLTEDVGGQRRIRSDAPVLFPLRDLPSEYGPDQLEQTARETLEDYKTTLGDDRRWLLDQYTVADIGVKVVGVGSVGTRCLIVLLVGRDDHDPLFLQAKEAPASVLEEHLGPSPYDNAGRRVVEGQRMIQAQSDPFLGWTQGREGRNFYLRQLRDWKGSIDVESGTPEQLLFYARMCGQTMARGHARSGDPCSIGAYMGKGRKLDRAIVEFAQVYAAQTERDYEAFLDAISAGRLEAADDPLK